MFFFPFFWFFVAVETFSYIYFADVFFFPFFVAVEFFRRCQLFCVTCAVCCAAVCLLLGLFGGFFRGVSNDFILFGVPVSIFFSSVLEKSTFLDRMEADIAFDAVDSPNDRFILGHACDFELVCESRLRGRLEIAAATVANKLLITHTW